MQKFKLQNTFSKHGRTILSVTVLLLVLYMFILNSLENKFIQDDAYTSLRYAKNFADGKGLVFNEGERVEGYTNFLWVMLLSGFYSLKKLGLPGFELSAFAQELSMFFGITAILILFFLSKEFNKNEPENIFSDIKNYLPPFLFALSAPMIYWSVSGMETSLFVSLTLLSFLIFLKRREKENLGRWFVMISLLNSLLRPEGMIFCGLLYFYKFIEDFSRGTKNVFNKSILVEISVLFILIAFYLIFRILYYGYPLPNTFYAKTEFTVQFLSRGLKYFYNFTKSNLLYGVFLFLPFVLLSDKKLRYNLWFGFYIMFVWIFLVVIIGGDVLPVHRFFLPILPIIFIMNVKAVFYLTEKIKSNKANLSLKILTLFLILVYGYWNYNLQKPSIQNFRSYESGLVKKMKIYAGWIKEQSKIKSMSKKKITVAMSTIGAFSYYSSARIIDIVGLADEYIAHHPKEVEGIDEELPVLWRERHYNADYVLSKKPDYIIFPAGAKPSAFAECALFVQNDFIKNYYVQLLYSNELNQLLPVFTRRNITAWKNEQEQDQEQDKNKCDIRFVKHYINAINLFIKMVEEKKYNLQERVLIECGSVIKLCPSRKAEAETIMGYSFYHSGEKEKAKPFFEDAVKIDSLNMIARQYLKSIYIEQRDTSAALKQIQYLKKFSPGIFTTFE
jgi:arabinofuranosyltransferase